MKGLKRHTAIILGSLLAAGLVAGAAAAGNPHGTPPGQAKKQQAGSSHRPTTPPGQAKGQSGGAGSTAGVKPSSTTRHNTYATAGSDQTKLYGNGSTAGQIAIANGASPNTVLYGPGNSQPHKVAVCSKNGKTHYVDVHALKSHASASCSSNSPTSSTEKVVKVTVVAAVEHVVKAEAAFARAIREALGLSHSLRTKTVRAKATHTKGGVLGAQFTLSKPVSGRAKAAQAVVGKATFTG